MKAVFAIASALLLSMTVPVVADNANWTEEKAAQVELNRNANSGLGNGGERRPDGSIALDDEVNRRDVDPGNSGAQCQGGKNACPG